MGWSATDILPYNLLGKSPCKPNTRFSYGITKSECFQRIFWERNCFCKCKKSTVVFIKNFKQLNNFVLIALANTSFYYGKIYIKFTFSTILRVQFSGINYTHTVVEPSPLSVSSTFHHPKQKLHTYYTTTSYSSLSSWTLLFYFLFLWTCLY